MLLRLLTLTTALAAACSLAATASATRVPLAGKSSRSCDSYSYAGFLQPTSSFGISGRLTLVAAPTVVNGHVAAWIGVGGASMGPNGTDAWVQAGISGFPDGHSELYYEYQLPHEKSTQYVSLGRIAPGESHDLGVYERPAQRGSWRVTLNGAKVSPPIFLPGSHGAWRPIATSENWDGGAGSCNRFSYDFSNLAVASQYGGGWKPFELSRPLQDRGYTLRPRLSGFAALTCSPSELTG